MRIKNSTVKKASEESDRRNNGLVSSAVKNPYKQKVGKVLTDKKVIQTTPTKTRNKTSTHDAKPVTPSSTKSSHEEATSSLSSKSGKTNEMINKKKEHNGKCSQCFNNRLIKTSCIRNILLTEYSLTLYF